MLIPLRYKCGRYPKEFQWGQKDGVKGYPSVNNKGIPSKRPGSKSFGAGKPPLLILKALSYQIHPTHFFNLKGVSGKNLTG
jgi:hypothetical protein